MKSKLIFLVAAMLLTYSLTAQAVTEKTVKGMWVVFEYSFFGVETYIDGSGNYYLETYDGKKMPAESDVINFLKLVNCNIKQIEFKTGKKYEIIRDSPEKGTFTIKEELTSFTNREMREVSFRDDKTGKVSNLYIYFKEDELRLQIEVETPEGSDWVIIGCKRKK